MANNVPWPPLLTWYDGNTVLASHDRSFGNTAQKDVLVSKATLAMDGKQYRCHTSYGNPPANAIKDDRSTHVYNRSVPLYKADTTITVTVHCEFHFHFPAWNNTI